MTGPESLDTAESVDTTEFWITELLGDTGDLEEFLTKLTRLISGRLTQIGAAAWCGMTLLRDRRPATVAFSHDEARALDEVQYQTAEGPCLTAAGSQTVVGVPDTGAEQRWPEFTRHARDLQIGSVLAVPFALPDGSKACLNVYFSATDAYDAELLETIQEPIRLAATLLDVAVRLAGHRETEADMSRALESRTTINLALGIIMGQNRCSQDEAFSILSSAASHRNIKLRHLAAELVARLNGDEATTHFE